jgi:hypothetical protein
MRLTSRAFTAYCTNEACPHARKPHPITGYVDSYGGFEDPGSATSECPACDWPLDDRPMFDTDEPISEVAA